MTLSPGTNFPSSLSDTYTTPWVVSQKILSAPLRAAHQVSAALLQARHFPENYATVPAGFTARFRKKLPSDFSQHPKRGFPA